MTKVSYQPLGPLLSGEGSRAFLGLEVTDNAPPRPVVLVWVPEELAKDPEAAAKIARETKRASQLEHPNIIRVLGLASLDEGTARVVEFADGESLRKVLDGAQKLPPPLAALVTADAAMGVHYAHVAGNDDGTPLLHGDIRPETLMVSFSGVCKATGYGALGVAPKESGGKRIQGRRLYCAPEQILGGREAINRQTDVYLLGLVLYECLSGQIPFKDDPHFDDAVLNRPLPPLSPEEVPEALIKVVEQATAKKAYDRYPTTRALRDAIERAVGVLPAHEELESFLRGFFPEDSPARSARRREVETGIAELARRASQRAQVSARTEEPAKVAKADESLGAQEAAAIQPSLPAPTMEHSSPAFSAFNAPKERTIATYIVPILLALAALGYWYLDHRNDALEDSRLAAEGAAKSIPAIIADAVSPPTASTQADPARSEPGLRALKPPDAETPTAPRATTATASARSSAAAADAPGRIQPAVAKGPGELATASSIPKESSASAGGEATLELTVEPAVDVAIDGRKVGRSPVNLPISPGKHAIQFTDASRGINVSRSIRVGDKGTTSQRLVIGKGTVEVSAPDGAAIFIDGKQVGTAPLQEVSVFEGKHQILATLGSAKWKQGFSVSPNERMSFKIETIEQ
jgi:eukaryotic-like serine/threonine-protein kinase